MKRNLLKRLTIRQRLPLLICLLLLTVTLSFGVVSYLGVRKASLKVGEDRLQTLSLQLSSMLNTSTHNLISAANAQANRASVKAYLNSNGKDSGLQVHQLFGELQKDSTWAEVRLLNKEQKILLSFSTNKTAIDFPLTDLPDENEKPDTGMLGKIYARENTFFYPVIATVSDGNRRIGYLIKWKKMQSRSKSLEQLSQLMGSDARIYIGNTDGSLWTDMVKPVGDYPAVNSETHLIRYSRSKTELLASIHPIANSPWMVAIEFPKDKILQTANSFLYWLMIAGTALILAGIFLGWLMSRNISEPLARLTDATSRIASGDFSSPVMVERYDEIGKLSRSFNAMMVQVQNSQSELELKAENYKLLFEKNPMPMWIMANETFNILDVNEAAIIHYGYSREEFLQLNSLDLRPAEDIEKFLEVTRRGLQGRNKHGIWRHKKKDGTVIMVDLIADDIIYKNQKARLTLCHDITEKLKAEAELIRHRIMQQEIITETTILVQEKEREEIGKELHDNINQILASTKLYLELARSENKELYPEAIAKSYDNINLAIGEIRQLSKQLVKPAFDTTLTDSLRDLTDEIKTITPIDIVFDGANFDEGCVEETIKLMIYRVVQEQLNNILKYAAASEVYIRLATDEGNVYLSIRDNGVGFDTTKKSKGIGLRNIDTRVKFHKGTAVITSAPGEGCRIDIEVPLKAETVGLYS